MDFIEATEAIEDAKRTVVNARLVQREAAKLVAGDLRSLGLSGNVLCKLKRELKDFNMQTWRWKE